MAAQQGEVVIRSADGTEHVFPPGFDPKRAADIVRGQPQTRAPMDVLAEGRKSAQIRDESQPSAISQWFETHLRPALEAAAHPRTLDDVASLLLAPTDASRSLGAALVSKAMGAVRKAVTATPNAAIRATAAVGDVIDPDVVGVVSPRGAKVLSLAQRLRDKLNQSATSAPASGPVASPAATPMAEAPAATAPRALSLAQLDPDERMALQQLVKQGYPEADVLRTLAEHRGATVTPPAPTPIAAGRASLKAAEMKEYSRLRAGGKMTHQEAMELIEAQRALQQRLGLPTSEETRLSVGDRNTTGRWREDR